MVPAEGGPKLLKLKSSWRLRRSKILAVSLRHWKGRGGLHGGGGGGPLLLRLSALLIHPCLKAAATQGACGRMDLRMEDEPATVRMFHMGTPPTRRLNAARNGPHNASRVVWTGTGAQGRGNGGRGCPSRWLMRTRWLYRLREGPAWASVEVETGRLLGGGGGAVRDRQIHEKLPKMAGNPRENCGAVPKPPEASKSNTFAQGTHGAPTDTRGGRAKGNCRKIRENAGKCKRLRNCEQLRIIHSPPPSPRVLGQRHMPHRSARRGPGPRQPQAQAVQVPQLPAPNLHLADHAAVAGVAGRRAPREAEGVELVAAPQAVQRAAPALVRQTDRTVPVRHELRALRGGPRPGRTRRVAGAGPRGLVRRPRARGRLAPRPGGGAVGLRAWLRRGGGGRVRVRVRVGGCGRGGAGAAAGVQLRGRGGARAGRSVAVRAPEWGRGIGRLRDPRRRPAHTRGAGVAHQRSLRTGGGASPTAVGPRGPRGTRVRGRGGLRRARLRPRVQQVPDEALEAGGGQPAALEVGGEGFDAGALR